jgi:hypothetical protein
MKMEEPGNEPDVMSGLKKMMAGSDIETQMMKRR